MIRKKQKLMKKLNTEKGEPHPDFMLPDGSLDENLK